MASNSYKVVLLGEGRVGKTSLVLRFCRDTFVDGQPPTIQASCLERALRLGDKTVNLVVWDTAGQERFHALGPIYYRDADAALLVFDITDTDSFKRVQGWVRELRKMVSAAGEQSAAPFFFFCIYLGGRARARGAAHMHA
jgi:Ras-related protein Rab-21